MALLEHEVGDDPITEVARWMSDALTSGVVEPFAMQVATAAEDRPTVRTVLLRGLDDRGFMFVTNLESTKSLQLAANPACGLTIVWTPLSRQVCATGRAERMPDVEIEAYWRTRPRGSQIAAWASAQSRVLADRAVLEQAVVETSLRFADTKELPVPPFWGGWRIVPDTVELWAGRPDRLHDRLRWRRPAPGQPWTSERLWP